MTLPSSGSISLSQVNTELGLSSTAQISFNDAAVRTLTGTTTNSTLTLPTNFYGKSNRVSISYTFTTSTVNASLNVTSIGGYLTGRSDITVTVNSGVYLWANSVSNYGLSLIGGTTGDTITLVNNGYIMGQGGDGAPANGSNGGSGGPALGIQYNTTINNSGGYIGGGGGGGAGNQWSVGAGGGGGAGGGWGAVGSSPYGCGPASGGSIGGYGSCSSFYCRPTQCEYSNNCYPSYGGGGGGRIMPGARTVYTVFGAGVGGSAGGSGGNTFQYAYPGGSYGGGPNETGGTGNGNGANAGGGGGWGGAGGGNGLGQNGGSAGKAIALNGYTATITGGSTKIYGVQS